MIKLTTTNIKYLILIRQISEKEETVRCTDIANILNVSKPGVHRMVETMKNMGLVNKDRYGEIKLTESGYKLAAEYSRYFDMCDAHWRNIIPENADKLSAICAFLAELTQEHIEQMFIRLTSA